MPTTRKHCVKEMRDSLRRRPRGGDADRRWRNRIREGEDINRRHFLRDLRAEVDKLYVRNFVTASFRSQEELVFCLLVYCRRGGRRRRRDPLTEVWSSIT